MEDGIVQLDALSKNIAPGTQEAVDKATADIKSGTQIYTGPIYDNTGTLQVPEGTSLTDDQIWNLTWLVDSISVTPDTAPAPAAQ